MSQSFKINDDGLVQKIGADGDTAKSGTRTVRDEERP